jgi:hypothetical protein
VDGPHKVLASGGASGGASLRVQSNHQRARSDAQSQTHRKKTASVVGSQPFNKNGGVDVNQNYY